MKWSIFVCFLVCLARFAEGGALRCPPGVLDPSCTEESKEINTQDSSISLPKEAQCLVGSEWESNCHYCRCSDSGIAECLKQDVCDKGVFAEPALCKPNTTFQRDCNTCVCLDNGLGLCTLQSCIRSININSALELTEDSSEYESTKKTAKADVVVPPRTFHREGNFLEIDHDMLKRPPICKPHEEFMRDCNPCKCAADGQSYSCTKNECLEVDMDKEVEVFMQSEITKSSKNETKSQVCVANRMFVKDCNTCYCNEDGTSYSCTRKICIPLLPDEEPDLGGIPAEDLRVTKKACRPDEVFELDCNTCRCNPDGKSYVCTRRLCEASEDKKNITLSRKIRSFTTETPKACQPGTEFRMDCNKCLCDSKGTDFSCTRMDCNALNLHSGAFTEGRSKRQVSDIELKCVPGSVFDRECNVCRCTEDGNHATCTLKRCAQNELDSEVHKQERDPGFRCNPGEQFKRDCKDCTCSADGKSVFCTLRLCDLDLGGQI